MAVRMEYRKDNRPFSRSRASIALFRTHVISRNGALRLKARLFHLVTPSSSKWSGVGN